MLMCKVKVRKFTPWFNGFNIGLTKLCACCNYSNLLTPLTICAFEAMMTFGGSPTYEEYNEKTVEKNLMTKKLGSIEMFNIHGKLSAKKVNTISTYRCNSSTNIGVNNHSHQYWYGIQTHHFAQSNTNWCHQKNGCHIVQK